MNGRTTAPPATALRRLEQITRDMSQCFDQLATAILSPDPLQRRAEASVLAARIGRDWERIARSLRLLVEEAEALPAVGGSPSPPAGGGRVRPVEFRLVPEPDGQPALDQLPEVC
ncbi:MAG TPA: hypothetical protein VE777_09005 [Gaiellales bacterium]|jgi:hypothetical protein|nr:hypothetical protein [Gaiellales bacterium]